MTDGLLIHGENWQALRLLEERHRGSVKCIYIDPPYNTNASAIIYKNGYKDSSWLSLMENRLSLSARLMSPAGVLCCAIDDEEVSVLRLTMQGLFAQELGIAPVRSNPAGRKSKGQFSPNHDYALFVRHGEATPGVLDKTEKEFETVSFHRLHGRFAWKQSHSARVRVIAAKIVPSCFIRSTSAIVTRYAFLRWSGTTTNRRIGFWKERDKTRRGLSGPG